MSSKSKIVPSNSQQEEQKCSFCARPASEVRLLVAGNAANICESCAEETRALVDGHLTNADAETCLEVLSELQPVVSLANKLRWRLPPDVLTHLLQAALILSEWLRVNYNNLLPRDEEKEVAHEVAPAAESKIESQP